MTRKTIPLIFLVLTWYAQTGFQTEQGKIFVTSDNEFVGTKKPFNLEEIYGHDFYSAGWNGTWISDYEVFYPDEYTDNYFILDTNTMKSIPFLNATLLSNYKRSVMKLSNDRKHILIGYDQRPQFRHSSLKKYVIYDVENQKYYPVADGADLSYAQWLPTGKDYIFVSNNNIYYTRFNDVNAQVTNLTTNGVPQVIYNGVPDWVYEEEVLESDNAIWISPDGNYLAFATFNDTGVKRVLYFYYGVPGSLKYQYPREMRIKYPKTNTPNPEVTLNLIDLKDPQYRIISLKAPEDVIDHDHILHSVTWLDGKRVAGIWMNRVQNHGQLMTYNTDGQEKRVLYLNETNGWLDLSNPIYHDGYLILLKTQESNTDAGKFTHVTRYNYNDGDLIEETDLTPGTIEVQKLIGIDKLRNRVYYLANELKAPAQRNFYSVSLKEIHDPECVSCNVITPEGNNCTYAMVHFSKNMSNYALSCTGPDPTFVRLYNSQHQELLVWERNEFLREKLTHRIRPEIVDLDVPSHGFQSKVRLYLPRNFDENKKYPLLVYVYGGPNTARITEESNIGLESYMTTNKSVIYASIDGRGSGHRGTNLMYQIYKKIGSVEIEDQITVTKYLQDTYPWIDANRTGIWGWSYGGYATAMTLATDKEKVFQCGLSVAPVSSWIYYDSIYTERYMGLPSNDDNLIGYNKSDVTRLVEGIRGKKFMMIHGTHDDNVHYQQAMALAKALEYADIPFEQMTYVDEAHGLVKVSPHFYHTMDRFWNDCFQLNSHGS